MGVKSLHRVVGQLGQMRRDGVRAGGREEQRVPVGRGARDLGRADRAARADLVLDHEGLARRLRDHLPEHPGDQVGGACAERHDHAHGLARPSRRLRPGQPGCGQGEDREARDDERPGPFARQER